MEEPFRGKKKKKLAQARHRRDCSACAKFTRLATGGETGYWWVDALHIYIYQCCLFFRQADDVTTTCLNLCLMWNVAFHTYSFIAAWFSDRLFPEPLQGKVTFSLNLLHSGVLRIYYYDQCSSIFRRAWNANRSCSSHISDLHIHQCGLVFRQAFFRSRYEAGWCFLICYGALHTITWSLQPDFQTGLEKHRCRYYEVAAEVTFYIVNFQWLSFDLERDTFPDLWWRFVGAPRTLLWGSLAKRCCNGGEIQTIWSLQCYAEFWNAQLKTVCATLGSLALYLPLFTIEFKLLLRLFPEPIRGRVFFIFCLIIWCITYKYMLIARFSDGHGIQYNVAVTWRSLQIWSHCQLQGDFIWF